MKGIKEERKSYLYSHDTEVTIINILVFILLVIMYISHIYINTFHIFHILYVISCKAIIILHMQFCEPFIYLTTLHKHLLMSLSNLQEYNLKSLHHFLISCICYKLFNQSHNTRHFFPVAMLV